MFLPALLAGEQDRALAAHVNLAVECASEAAPWAVAVKKVIALAK